MNNINYFSNSIFNMTLAMRLNILSFISTLLAGKQEVLSKISVFAGRGLANRNGELMNSVYNRYVNEFKRIEGEFIYLLHNVNTLTEQDFISIYQRIIYGKSILDQIEYSC